MRRDAGFTIVELLVASAIMLATTAAVFTVLSRALTNSRDWNDAADLHQRGRVVIEAISRIVSAAGASLAAPGPVPLFPPLEPRRRSTFLPSASAITVRHVPDLGAWARLTSALPPEGTAVDVDARAGCPAGLPACGLAGGMDAVVLDDTAGWHLLTVQAVADSTAQVNDRVPGRTRTFPAGATIAEIVETALYFDRASRTLRQEGPGEGDFPVADNVEDITFEYFGAGLAPIALAALSDGPLCGTGSLAYDCDLHHVRHVRTTVTIASARAGARPLRLVVDLSPRNLSR